MVRGRKRAASGGHTGDYRWSFVDAHLCGRWGAYISSLVSADAGCDLTDSFVAEGDWRGTEIDTRETIGSGERHRDVGD